MDPGVITGAFTRERVGQREVKLGKQSLRPCWLWKWRKGAASQGCGWLLETEKSFKHLKGTETSVLHGTEF